MSKINYRPLEEKIKAEPEEKKGYVRDYITNTWIKATPEEIEAVQIFVKQLVEDYNYPKEHIQTRPQYRVKQRPSGGKEFPVDIAVFSSDNHTFDNEYILVECKKRNRKDSKKQLEDYLHFSKAYLGVWFNGEERLFLRKIEKQGKIFFEEIPNIPQYGQRVEDIGKFRRKDLKPTHNLKATFKAIRNHLAANTVGATRDEVLAQQLINLIFCKIYDERFTEPNDIVTFRAGVDEEAIEVKERILDLFERVKRKYKEVLDESDTIALDVNSIAYVVGELQNYCLIEAERDIIADAFETFIGHALNKIRGIDKDYFLAKVAKAYMAIIGDGKSGIVCEDSLENPKNWNEKTKTKIHLNDFSVLLTNPPFGSKIPVRGEEKLKQFDLAHKWKQDKKTGEWEKGKLKDKEAPQILFIERCLQLLKDDGRMAIVLPEGIFGNPTDRYIFEYIFENAKILGIVSCPPETFQPNTHTKTSILFLEKNKNKNKQKDYNFFVGIAEKAGHDKNGKIIYKMDKYGKFILGQDGQRMINDDLPIVIERFKKFKRNGDRLKDYSHLGFSFKYSKIKDYILIPDYYNPDIEKELKDLERTGKYQLTNIQSLIEKKILIIKRGNEIGSHFYGTGDVPFVRTTDIVNLEIKADPVKCVAEEVYEIYKSKQDVREFDILFVNDGTFLIGRSAMLTKLDKSIIIQSHIRKIRLKENNLLDSYLLFYLLNTHIVKKQIEAKTFVQATISTLGNRLSEVILPIPKDAKEKKRLSSEMKAIVEGKMKLREKSIKIIEI